MKRFRIVTMCFAAIFAAALVSSCSNDETAEQQNRQEAPRATTVKELTAQLRAYNAGIAGDMTVVQPLKVRKPGLTLGDKISIAIADVKGGARGFTRGGVGGAVLGAAVSSFVKYMVIAAKKDLWPVKSLAPAIAAGPSPIAPKIFAAGSVPAFGDSVGYYHNMIEAEMYKTDPYAYQRPSSYLVGQAENILRKMSTGYKATGELTDDDFSAVVRDVDAFRNADTDELSFDGYCDLLKSLNPEDGDYIDFAAEYLYIVFYGNVNIDDYTEEVFYMINNSNAGVEDVALLNKCIQVAYASVLFSNCTEI